MKVRIPPPLQSYTRGSAAVEAGGSTLAELLGDLDARYPGIRFRMIDEQDRIRPHIKVFVNAELTATIERPLAAGDDVLIICALSGG